ncbi:MAG: GNAT family N-acetyltransferase [Actinomycetota bacterium]|nr:GNAT family N-acetyltransferase [Actinomycetota bacterium]
MTLAGLREAADDDSWALIALIGACWAEYPGCVMDVAGEYRELLAPASHYQAVGGTLWVLPEGDWIAACVGIVGAAAARTQAVGPVGPVGPVGRVGAAAARTQPVELVKLYVARHRRNQGVGAALVKVAEQQARDRGAIGVELWSDSRFHEAHRLYQRLGYRQTGASRQLRDLSKTTEYAFHKAFTGE